jgi:polar amino acid transport system permease protein
MAPSFVAFFDVIVNWGPSLLRGAVNTIALVALCLPLTLALGSVVGMARLSRVWPIRVVARLYVEIFRGVSLFVTIFWLYFALPFLRISLSPWGAAVLALVLVHSAYASEYVRSTVLGVPKAQFEAAQALNMTQFQSMRYIIFPQALAAMMPLIGNELVLLLKGTSIASLISVAELTEHGRSVIMSTYHAFPTLLAVLLIYYVLAQMLTWCERRLERHITRWRSVAELDRSLEPGLATQLQSRWHKLRT